ncbi:hypothetical protein NL676_004563 [Syzygium grande]|nr:hypothetical protein NL676_004563 [Syzygium grande]
MAGRPGGAGNCRARPVEEHAAHLSFRQQRRRRRERGINNVEAEEPETSNAEVVEPSAILLWRGGGPPPQAGVVGYSPWGGTSSSGRQAVTAIEDPSIAAAGSPAPGRRRGAPPARPRGSGCGVVVKWDPWPLSGLRPIFVLRHPASSPTRPPPPSACWWREPNLPTSSCSGRPCPTPSSPSSDSPLLLLPQMQTRKPGPDRPGPAQFFD